MYIHVIQVRLRENFDAEAYLTLDAELKEILRTEPQFGFLSYQDYANAEGEIIAFERFSTHEGVDLWRKDARHRAAMKRGRKEFFASYHGWVCTLDHDYSFTFDPAQGEEE
ncbi:MAG: hypothetical protein WCJ28_00380 [Actinomycetota bacterium]